MPATLDICVMNGLDAVMVPVAVAAVVTTELLVAGFDNVMVPLLAVTAVTIVPAGTPAPVTACPLATLVVTATPVRTGLPVVRIPWAVAVGEVEIFVEILAGTVMISELALIEVIKAPEGMPVPVIA